MTKKSKIKICLVCSAGGHFYQVLQLKEWWSKYEYFWVISNRVDTKETLEGGRVYHGYFPENRNLMNALKNLLLAIRILKKERPDIIFSTGAGIAPPFYLIGKLLGIKLIFLETASHIGIPTLSGKLVYHFCDTFLVQHKFSKKFYPKAEMHGTLI